jgi:hypothetical protein
VTSLLSTDAIPSEDGCWRSFSGSRSIAAAESAGQSCRGRRGVSFTTSNASESRGCLQFASNFEFSQSGFSRGHMGPYFGNGGATQEKSPRDMHQKFQDLQIKLF